MSLSVPVSATPGIVWPALPAAAGAMVLALQYQFERTEWLSPVALQAVQFRQLELLLAHAKRTVPFYRDRLAAVLPLEPGGLSIEAWRRIPVLRRPEVQAAGIALVSRACPKDHGPSHTVRTSGSTGRPISVKGTRTTAVFAAALNLRYQLWHRRDFAAKVAAIRPLKGARIKAARSGRPLQWVPGYPSGPMYLFGSGRPVNEQLDWLLEQNPRYLLIKPSNLRALVRLSQETAKAPLDLREVITYSEVLDPAIRAACAQAWGVKVTDAYSAEEVGMIALECPKHPHYHVQAESVFVEILAADGTPCAPGEVGRVVVTPLHNFATPLVRYELGDYAEAGGPCDCGRGLPVLKRILGRYRNMLTFPSGEQAYPGFHADVFLDVAPVRQFQLVQRSLEEIEVRLVVTPRLTAEQEDRLRAVLAGRLRHPFAFRFAYVEEIPRSPSGKFEDFISEIPER